MSLFRHPIFLRLRTLLPGAPRRPRNPVLRSLLGVLGVTLLIGLVAVGLVVGLAMLLGGLVLRLLVRRDRNVRVRRQPLEGSYRVVGKPQLAR
ncbi:MAG: hypothetical protein K6T33_05340 [Thermomonas hydrothermalis]|uniref:hypothetical protein n=1 Tax=Thermomonas hydrothermalis TaxID=213588 RepID=UPI0023529864|nr:hypothetical protein [Thermomonas hydrothermalis]MCL6619196.1 hypothetical protein [Thermomonas hydrothermalis]